MQMLDSYYYHITSFKFIAKLICFKTTNTQKETIIKAKIFWDPRKIFYDMGFRNNYDDFACYCSCKNQNYL